MNIPQSRNGETLANAVWETTYGPMNWREKMARQRTRLGLSQADLGRLVGLQQSRINRWENGDGKPSMEQGQKLARALGVPLDWLAADDSTEEPPAPELTPDERAIIRSIRGSGLTYEEVMGRLIAGPAGRAPTEGEVITPRPFGRSSRQQG